LLDKLNLICASAAPMPQAQTRQCKICHPSPP
jgi:hypothetical protein